MPARARSKTPDARKPPAKPKSSAKKPKSPAVLYSDSDKQMIFDKIDINGDGMISLYELEVALSQLGMSASKAQAMFLEADVDGNGEIDFDEYSSIVDRSSPWKQVQSLSARQQVELLLTAGSEVLKPVHDTIRMRNSQVTNIAASGGFNYVKPSGITRLVFSIIGCILFLFAPFFWLAGYPHAGYWLGNFMIVDKSGHPVGFGYILARLILRGLLHGMAVPLPFLAPLFPLIDFVSVVCMGGKTLVDGMLGGTVVCIPSKPTNIRVRNK
jgi:hypothetical protein